MAQLFSLSGCSATREFSAARIFQSLAQHLMAGGNRPRSVGQQSSKHPGFFSRGVLSVRLAMADVGETVRTALPAWSRIVGCRRAVPVFRRQIASVVGMQHGRPGAHGGHGNRKAIRCAISWIRIGVSISAGVDGRDDPDSGPLRRHGRRSTGEQETMSRLRLRGLY